MLTPEISILLALLPKNVICFWLRQGDPVWPETERVAQIGLGTWGSPLRKCRDYTRTTIPGCLVVDVVFHTIVVSDF